MINNGLNPGRRYSEYKMHCTFHIYTILITLLLCFYINMTAYFQFYCDFSKVPIVKCVYIFVICNVYVKWATDKLKCCSKRSNQIT